jgi:hypothetical protein
LVPSVIVTGRSVLSRNVMQGMPKIVVSSCTPPESVITKPAVATNFLHYIQPLEVFYLFASYLFKTRSCLLGKCDTCAQLIISTKTTKNFKWQ